MSYCFRSYITFFFVGECLLLSFHSAPLCHWRDERVQLCLYITTGERCVSWQGSASSASKVFFFYLVNQSEGGKV